jgi:hypothetical protein
MRRRYSTVEPRTIMSSIMPARRAPVATWAI